MTENPHLTTPEPDAADVDSEMVEMNFMEADTLRRINLAREQGRAEGDAEWAAAVEEMADSLRCATSVTHLASYCSSCQAADVTSALLTADRTKALDAMKAQVWDEAAEAVADWMSNNPSPSGIPQDPPRNPYDGGA